MKKIIPLLLILLISDYLFGQGQGSVYLEGKQFKLNGSNYYPVCLNYGIASVHNSSNYYAAPSHMYGSDNSYECFNTIDCDDALQNDFNTIATMGFNSIRIAGFYPKYDVSLGLVFPMSPHNLQASDLLLPTSTSNLNSIIFPMYSKILQLAENAQNTITLQAAPLKVIFILTGNVSNYTLAEQTEYENFASALATFISTDANKSALLAYDMMNEPCYHDLPSKTKNEACTMINNWYWAFKDNDPNHLVTLGTCGPGDLFEFDPSIITTDFLSLHTYPVWRSFEDKSQPAIIQRGFDRVAVDMLWQNRVSSVPWIIGETSLSADDINAPLQGIIAEGTEVQQKDFASFTLDATCSCGGSGYSWWVFQDACHMSLNNSSSWWGLLRMCPLNGHQGGEKPVVDDIFRNYISPPDVASCSTCPISYNPNYNATSLYYNSYQHPSNPSKVITGIITDHDGNPIKDAIIGAHDDIDDNGTPLIGNDDTYIYHTTFSDQNGHFEIIPYDFLPPFNNPGTIANVKISAPGAERLNFGWCCNSIPNNNIINVSLEKVTFNYHSEIDNIIVPSSSTRNFKGYNSLTASNITILNTAVSEMSARKQIDVLTEFHAEYGSEVHVFCDLTFSDCNDFNSFIMNDRVQSSSYVQDLNRNIEIDFRDLKETQILVYPNPTSGNFTILFDIADNETLIRIKIMDILGNQIETHSTYSNQFSCSLLDRSKGIYIIELKTSNKSYFKKVIIQ